jgi:hypothetical protein
LQNAGRFALQALALPQRELRRAGDVASLGDEYRRRHCRTRQSADFLATRLPGLRASRQQNRGMRSSPEEMSPRVGVIALALFAATSAHAATTTSTTATTITCPPMLVETPVVSSLLAGWEVDVRAGRRTLSGAAVHVSRGSDRGGVPPDATAQSGRQETAWWTLSPGDGSVYWVACSYGNTSALLLQRIPDTARRCVASHEVLKSGRQLNVQPVRCE